MKRRPWTAEEVERLRREYPDTRAEDLARSLGRQVRSVYHKARTLGLKKSPAFLASSQSGRWGPGENPSETTQFKKGITPWNKGTRFDAGGRSVETRFLPGHRSHNWLPVGTEVVDCYGYRKRKIRDDAPVGRAYRNWKFVHVLLWEEHYGPVPKGMTVVFRNKDRSDIRIENLDLIGRKALMERNSVHNYPKPLVRVIQLRGVLNRKINSRMRGSDEKQD